MDVLEIKTRDGLEAWFENYPPAVAQVVATRAALRVLPFIVEGKGVKNFSNDILLPVFWALTASWVACRYPKRDVAADSAADAVRASAGAAHAASDSAVFASAASAAASAVFAHAASDRAPVHAAAANAATASASASRVANAARTASRRIAWKENLQDCAFLEAALQQEESSEQAARDLAGQPLWRSQSIPEETIERWGELNGFLSNAGDSWQVWFDWYYARLEGGNTIDVPSDQLETLDVSIATLDEKLWKQGPAVVNAKIQELMDDAFDEAAKRRAAEDNSEDNPSDVDEDLEQRPSISSFRIRNGKIVADPYPVESVDQLRDALWRETLAKAQETMERLQRTQAPDHVTKTLEKLIEDLGSSVQAVNPGSILMRSRALDAILATFNTEEYRSEMMADAYAMFDDLVGSVSLFKASYPEILRIEAAQVAQEMTRDNVDKVRRYLDDVIEITEKSECVDETAQQALKKPIPAIQAIEAAINDAKTDGARAVGIERRAEAVSQSLLEVQNFSAAALLSNATKKVGESAGRGVLKGVETGTEKVVSTAVVTGISLLVAELVSPLAGLALFVGSFGPLAKKGEKQTSQEPEENDDDDITEA